MSRLADDMEVILQQLSRTFGPNMLRANEKYFEKSLAGELVWLENSQWKLNCTKFNLINEMKKQDGEEIN